MNYYSTNGNAPIADLHKAVVKGLAEDRGLYMPEKIKQLPKEFFDNIDKLSFQEVAYTVADAFFGEDVEADALKQIVYDTLSFDCPVVKVTDNIYSLELFHGPTLALWPPLATRDPPLPTASSVSTASTSTCSIRKERSAPSRSASLPRWARTSRLLRWMVCSTTVRHS